MKIYKERNSTFFHNGKKYDLNKIFKIVHDKPIRVFYVKDLKWILNHTKVNKKRVEEAALQFPIIITKKNDKYIIVDGAHRLQKYINIWKNIISSHKMKINGKYLTKKELDSTLIK